MPYRPLAAEAGFVHVCAHRGHSIAAPENTLPALEAAAAHGADACEIDVVLSADGEIIVIHDELLDRTTDGKGRVAAFDTQALARLDAGSWFDPRFAGTRLPTLTQALTTARTHRLALLIEIKERQRPDRLIERLAVVLAEQRALDDVLVISFDHPSLRRAQTRISGLRTEIITHARHVDPVAVAHNAGLKIRSGSANILFLRWDAKCTKSPPVKSTLKFPNFSLYASTKPSISLANPSTAPVSKLVVVSYPISGTLLSAFTKGSFAVK